MTKVLTEKNVEYRVSQISGSQALSGIVVTDEMKGILRKVISGKITSDTAITSIKLKYMNKIK